MKLEAVLNGVSIVLGSSKAVITAVEMHGTVFFLANINFVSSRLSFLNCLGMDAMVTMRPNVLNADVSMRTIGITDPNPNVKYPKVFNKIDLLLIILIKSIDYRLFYRFFLIRSFLWPEKKFFIWNLFNSIDRTKKKRKWPSTNSIWALIYILPKCGLYFWTCGSIIYWYTVVLFIIFWIIDRFIDWIDFFQGWLEPFQKAAAQAATQAGSALGQGAKDAAEIFQQQQVSKMKLDVSIDAPIVIMPQNSKSDEGILVHFGKFHEFSFFFFKIYRLFL